jgi:tetratricopeptide (TPR) repeat protein
MRRGGGPERDPGEPDHLHTVAGVGYRFVPREPAKAPTNLRPVREPPLGREEDTAELARALGRSEVALVGPAGVGKTRLACWVAWERRAAFLGGVWFCDLSQARTAADLLVEVGNAAGQQPRDAAAFGAWLAQQPPVLLVLDNADAVTVPLVEVLPLWVAAAPSARFLVTSRVLVPSVPCRRLEPLPPQAALRLLELRVIDLGGELVSSDRGSLPELVERLDRLPLALECAAFPLATTMSVRELLEHLQRFRHLPAPGDPAREAAMGSALAASWALLGAELGQALIMLAALPGPVSGEGAAAALDRELKETMSLLAALRQRSLITAVRAPSEPDKVRFALYESVRDFVTSLAGFEDERQAAWRRYLQWLLVRGRVGNNADLASPAQRFLAAERAALLAGVEEAERDPESAVRALLLLQGSWLFRDPVSYARAFERILPLDRGRLSREFRLAGQSMRAYALARAREGDVRDHVAALEQVVAQLGPDDPPWLGVASCSRYSATAFSMGDATRAAQGGLLSLRYWGEQMSSHQRTGAHISVGNALRLLGELERAEEQYRLALAVPDEPHGHGVAWSNLALLRPPVEAVDLFRRAFAVMPPENLPSYSEIRASFASALATSGAWEEARAEALRARADGRETANFGGWFRANLVLAQLDREGGPPEQALAWLDELVMEPRMEAWQSAIWDLRGTILLEAGRTEAAVTAFQTALTREKYDSPYDVFVLARAHLAVALARLGHHAQAREELPRAQQHDSPPLPGSVRAWALPRLALVVRALDPSSSPAQLERARQALPASDERQLYLPLEVAMAQRWLEQAMG